MTRPLLSLRHKAEPASGLPANDPQDLVGGGADAGQIIAVAIAQHLTLRARYNGGTVLLQPSLLYREHDALFLLAVTALRDGKPPREAKLGTFRVVGLNDLSLTDERFAPRDLHRAWADKDGRHPIAGLPR